MIVARIVSALFALLFAYAGYLQLNDGFALMWVLVYLGPAIVCAVFAAGVRMPLWLPAQFAAFTGVWAVVLATVVFSDDDLTQMFPDEEETGYVLVDTEEGREMGGLAIVAVAMLGVAVLSSRLPARDPA